MRLADTSAFIEWLMGTATGEDVATQLPKRDSWLVPTIVLLELSKWLTREVGEEKADQVIAFTQMCNAAETLPHDWIVEGAHTIGIWAISRVNCPDVTPGLHAGAQ